LIGLNRYNVPRICSESDVDLHILTNDVYDPSIDILMHAL